MTSRQIEKLGRNLGIEMSEDAEQVSGIKSKKGKKPHRKMYINKSRLT